MRWGTNQKKRQPQQPQISPELARQIEAMRQQAMMDLQRRTAALLAAQQAAGKQPRKPKKRTAKQAGPEINPLVLFAVLLLLYFIFFK